MLKKAITQINNHHLWAEEGLSCFVRQIPYANFREFFIFPTLVASNNSGWIEPPTTFVIEVRWLRYAVGVRWIKQSEKI